MDRINELWRFLLEIAGSLFESDWGVTIWLDRLYLAFAGFAPFVRLFDYVVDIRFFFGLVSLYLGIQSFLMVMRFVRFAAQLFR